MIVKDASVLIHLAKITILEASCDYFQRVIIPKKVYGEVLAGRGKGFGDVEIVMTLIEMRKIAVLGIRNNDLVEKANNFNIQGGEAAATALYWQEKADYLATDDDNVRKKAQILQINLIGTPSILLKLFKKGKIDEEKYKIGINELKKIGWFSNAIIDSLNMELKNGKTDRNKAI